MKHQPQEFCPTPLLKLKEKMTRIIIRNLPYNFTDQVWIGLDECVDVYHQIALPIDYECFLQRFTSQTNSKMS
jgi:hypothetical protein